MRSYARFEGAALAHNVGTNGENGYRIGDGVAGYLSYGPYLGLAIGHYTAGFYLRRRGEFDRDCIDIDVVCNDARSILASRQVQNSEILTRIPGLVKIDFHVTQNSGDIEVRLRVPDTLILEIRELVIFRRDTRGRGGI